MIHGLSSGLPKARVLWGHFGQQRASNAIARSYASLPEDLRSAFGFCVQQVRQYDYLNYVWVAQMPKDLRPSLFALRAFNIETALVADSVRSKESVVGQIRFQWWRDAVKAAFENRPPNHPVAFGGAAGNSPSRFSRYCFKRIIDCREADFLDPQPPLDLQALEQYAEGTSSQLMYLQLAAAGVKHQDADHAASHLGRAAGITTLLRGTAAHAAARRCYLPVDLCAEARVSQEDVYSGVVSEGLRDVVHKVASLAKGHLDEARRLAPRLPPGAAGVMLPAVAVGRYLEGLEAVNFNPYETKL
ncbi:hypothetical protein VOLCADRAFT_77474, partial [Volvox carteri f. nagariensis]